MDGLSFVTYLEQILGPELRPGDLVICDNLSSHKVEGVRHAIEKRQAHLLYLPAYSPDLNPIEMAFAKLKAALRRASKRTLAGLIKAVAAALETFTPTHCANFFRHASYASS
jgi:transposase